MNAYRDLLYRRGFLLTDIKNPVFNDIDAQDVFDQWLFMDIGDCRLFYDPSLHMGSAIENDCMLVILGLVLNPFDQSYDSVEIARKLLTGKKSSEKAFLDYLNQLSGRFVILSKGPGKLEVLHDACGTRTVFYDLHSPHIMVSSHATLIASLMDYEISTEALEIFYNKSYKDTNMKKLPGIMSPYEHVRILTPNTRLFLPQRTVERFFPLKNNESCECYDDLEYEVANLMSMQVKLLNRKASIAMSLTAGMDSRLSLAASKDIADQMVFFTYRTGSSVHLEDAAVASRICRDLKLSHRVYEWKSEYREGLEDFKAVWRKNLGIERGTAWLHKIFADSYPKNRIHIRSNLAEIVKGDAHFYQQDSLTDAYLAHMYSTSEISKDPQVIDKFAEFMRVADFSKKSLYNYDFRDMFEWEHLFCQWHSWMLIEGDMSHDTFLLYNNREILSRMLSLPPEDRLKKKIFIGVIKRLWPELMAYPFNGKRLSL